MRLKISPFLAIPILLMIAGCSYNIPFSIFKTATPLPTSTPTASPTPTSTPLPTATPTPPPATRILSGDKAFQDGDFDTALASYDFAFNLTNDPDIKAAALSMKGRIYYQQESTLLALTTLQQVTESYTSPEYLSMAYVYLGEIYTGLQRYAEAAAAYQSYLDLKPGILDSRFLEKKGDALTANGQYADANTAYEAAIAASPVTPVPELDMKIASNLSLLGAADAAIQRYQFVENSTANEYTKAQAEFLIGQIYFNQGNTVAAFEHFQNDVNNYPRSFDSYSALSALVNAGEPVNNLNRGIVDYYAGQYNIAITALDDYEGEFNTHDGSSHYYKALSYTALSDYPNATKEWDALIGDHPGDRFWTVAWDQKSISQWKYQNNYEAGAQTLLDFVATAPQDSMAPGFLYKAGWLYEYGNFLDQAAVTWERLATDYPSAEQASSAIYLTGITRYRQQNYDAALSAFQRSLLLASTPVDTSSAYLWLGKTQLIMNDPVSAQTSWQQAVQKDPTGYYSERARDLLINRAPFTACPVFDLAVDLGAEKQEAIAWMRKTFNLGVDVDLIGLNTLAQDPRMIRGKELWRLGFFEEARNDFEGLRLARELDAVDTFRLTQFFLDTGVYRSAIFAARQVLSLGGLDDTATFNAPIYFNHIRFGAYYRDIVMQAAKEQNLDPLLLLSLMRQESLFEGFIQSSAGANGLMQMIPTTAKEAANNMGWPPSYLDQDIFRPYINIRLGSYHLRQQIDLQDGDMYAGLTSYNSGDHIYARIWREVSNGDLDLYLEIVEYKESQEYIRRIVELYDIYRMFYCRTQ